MHPTRPNRPDRIHSAARGRRLFHRVLGGLATPEEARELAQSLTDREALTLLFDWRFWARPKQLPGEGAWSTWLILAGRGWGKTRTGSEWIRERVEQKEGKRIALVGKTPRDVRQVMLEGDSGLLNVFPPSQRPIYNPSLAQVTFFTGAVAHIYSGEEPDQLRGPQHDTAWVDEPAKFKYPTDTWDQLMLGMRLGRTPRVVATTTPRPIKLILDLISDEKVRVTRGHTRENEDNLSELFLDEVTKKYEGTELGRQELAAEILKEVAGAIWSRELIEKSRVKLPPGEWVASTLVGPDGRPMPPKFKPEFKRVLISVDPAVSTNAGSDETGIGVIGLGADNHGYLVADVSGKYTPNDWARIVVDLYDQWEADAVVAEVNNGGDLVETNVRNFIDTDGKPRGKNVNVKQVRAKRGKAIRAEPVKGLFEQNRFHLVGAHAELEDEMCTWVPGVSRTSPDRLDMLVWGATELQLEAQPDYRVRPL